VVVARLAAPARRGDVAAALAQPCRHRHVLENTSAAFSGYPFRGRVYDPRRVLACCSAMQVWLKGRRQTLETPGAVYGRLRQRYWSGRAPATRKPPVIAESDLRAISMGLDVNALRSCETVLTPPLQRRLPSAVCCTAANSPRDGPCMSRACGDGVMRCDATPSARRPWILRSLLESESSLLPRPVHARHASRRLQAA
jgi:hypothetical protein